MSRQQTSPQIPETKQFHGLLGDAVLAIWCDIDPENEAEFNNWYTHQHLPERIGIPGFFRGRRYVALEVAPTTKGAKYFTLYETETLQTLTSPAYLERLNHPTDWTKRMVPQFRNSNRTACKVSASQGQGIGGYAATIEFGPAEGNVWPLRDWLINAALPKALEHYEVVGIHLCEADESTTRAKDQTVESQGTDTQRPLARWVVIVESIDPQGLEKVCSELCGNAGLSTHGGTSDVTVNQYQLLISLSE